MESIATISLINLALDLSIDWKMLGRYLKLHQEVSSICADYEEVAEQAYRMLQLWRGKNGTQATYQALGKALKQVPRNDLVEDYCIGKNKDFLDQGEGTTPLDEEMEKLALASSPENNFETAVAGTDR
ncbi:hypothetical protein AWC38_SpisGene8846 [Stylophora pistillata]|uniref:Death domain-containing protein n=1 Tax=Stylophora pistillata TaxID=50429 RepID=A0A2B4SD23_STYPI|nr:hypothetical protein AWC38_SpisGene8846 [Stylophora pistillata]